MVAKHQIMSKSIKWHSTVITITISIDALLHLFGNTKLLNRQKTEKDSPVRAIMNVMFRYCRMLWSEASYWRSSIWERTKEARVVW
jgi:hypothetical protein